MVRESLGELDLLRKEHEDIYREIQSCYGLEKCMKEFNILDAQTSKKRKKAKWEKNVLIKKGFFY